MIYEFNEECFWGEMSAFAALKSFLKVICCDTKMTHTSESYKSEINQKIKNFSHKKLLSWFKKIDWIFFLNI